MKVLKLRGLFMFLLLTIFTTFVVLGICWVYDFLDFWVVLGIVGIWLIYFAYVLACFDGAGLIFR